VASTAITSGNRFLVDTNVLIDLIENDPQWTEWSEVQLLKASAKGALFINAVIYAELVLSFASAQQLDAFLLDVGIEILTISREAAFLAGQAFITYRRRKGAKNGVLPDFFIGAQSQAEGLRLLTRDATRYKTYFPKIKIISPAQ
jgi:predicted nucleic acid-binding protein